MSRSALPGYKALVGLQANQQGPQGICVYEHQNGSITARRHATRQLGGRGVLQCQVTADQQYVLVLDTDHRLGCVVLPSALIWQVLVLPHVDHSCRVLHHQCDGLPCDAGRAA